MDESCSCCMRKRLRDASYIYVCVCICIGVPDERNRFEILRNSGGGAQSGGPHTASHIDKTQRRVQGVRYESSFVVDDLRDAGAGDFLGLFCTVDVLPLAVRLDPASVG